MRTTTLALLLAALAAGACTSSDSHVRTDPAAVAGTAAAGASRGEQDVPRSIIAFVSTRDDPSGDLHSASEIYLMNADATDPVRLTNNAHGDIFPAPSPDGKRILFESNRLRAAGEPGNISDLFLMNADGTGQVRLIRGSSGTWSPDGKSVAFHSSASGAGQPISAFPGAATSDSDIFVMNVDDFVNGGTPPRNLTRSAALIDDDPDWSPDGRTILFTSHAATDNPTQAHTAEIYSIHLDGTGQPARLTDNDEEERGPAWSPDGKRVVFCCRRGGSDFEICVMNADGSGQVRLTDNAVADLTPSWSPDGGRIAFHRAMAGRGTLELWVMNADGSGQAQLTDTPGQNAFPNWNEIPGRAIEASQ